MKTSKEKVLARILKTLAFIEKIKEKFEISECDIFIAKLEAENLELSRELLCQ